MEPGRWKARLSAGLSFGRFVLSGLTENPVAYSQIMKIFVFLLIINTKIKSNDAEKHETIRLNKQNTYHKGGKLDG